MRQLVRAGAVVAAGLSVSLAAHAQEEKLPWYTGAQGLYFIPDHNRDAANGVGGRAFFGKQVADHLMVELGGFYYSVDKQTSGSDHASGGSLDFLIPFTNEGVFRPFLLVGGGGINQNYNGHYEFDGMANAGVGTLIRLTDTLFFRADGRYVWADEDMGTNNYNRTFDGHVNLGLVAMFGGQEAPPEPVQTACVDSDGDGVCDDADLCPGTAAGTAVDAKGCPVEKAAPAMAANQKFEDVHFAFDKSDLDAEAQSILDNASTTIGELVKTYPDLKVEVSGHTDWIGTDGYNQGLSERRANSVKTYLTRKGVDAGRITTYAYGESRPIATNETAEGRALNRRAEVETKE
jgi:OOP family OmpA-OmpF porin